MEEEELAIAQNVSEEKAPVEETPLPRKDNKQSSRSETKLSRAARRMEEEPAIAQNGSEETAPEEETPFPGKDKDNTRDEQLLEGDGATELGEDVTDQKVP